MTVLVLDADLSQPGVHALVIGVGRYPFLKGGGSLPTYPTMMGQLDAAPKSALAFSDWVRTKLHIANKPLRRLDVLASPCYPVIDHQGLNVTIDAPTLQNVAQAVRDWKQHADANEDNVTVLYFCGHGLSVGEDEALLLEGFGDMATGDHLQEAFSPSGLITGMQSCKATLQVFFFDACRNQDRQVADSTTGLANVNGILRAKPSDAKSEKDQVIFRSTQAGMAAYATDGQASRFTEAFVQAMLGAGATDDDAGDWVVEPLSLQLGLNWLMDLDPEKSRQWIRVDAPARRLTIHSLQHAPIVPVKVTCKPLDALGKCVLEHSGTSGKPVRRMPPENQPWHLMLPLGFYDFHAYDQGAKVKLGSNTQQARPPKVVVAIDCAKGVK